MGHALGLTQRLYQKRRRTAVRYLKGYLRPCELFNYFFNKAITLVALRTDFSTFLTSVGKTVANYGSALPRKAPKLVLRLVGWLSYG